MVEYVNGNFYWNRKTTKGMGKVFASIELLNSTDVDLAGRHLIGEEEIKRIRIRPQVDTGADELCINENIQEVLQFPVKGFENVLLADGTRVKCKKVGSVEIRFENRICSCGALVLPGDTEPLLGLIPLEAMDVIIDPNCNELLVNPEYPDVAHSRL